MSPNWKAFHPPSIFFWIPEPIVTCFQFQQTSASPREVYSPAIRDVLGPDWLEIYKPCDPCLHLNEDRETLNFPCPLSLILPCRTEAEAHCVKLFNPKFLLAFYSLLFPPLPLSFFLFSYFKINHLHRDNRLGIHFCEIQLQTPSFIGEVYKCFSCP